MNEPSAETLPSYPPEIVAEWKRFRVRYGLRYDIGWMLRVAADPTSANEMTVPLLGAEIDQVAQRNMSVQSLVPAVERYGELFPDEYAGVYIDELTTIVVEFTDRVPEHRADLATLFGALAPIEVRSSPYSIDELDALAKQVQSDAGWFRTVGAELYSAGVGEIENAVIVRYRADDEEVEAAIRDHFGSQDWLVLERLGPLPWTGPRGDLRVSVVDLEGDPVEVDCYLVPEDPRVGDSQLPFESTGGACAAVNLPAIDWEVRVSYGPDRRRKTSQSVRVPPGGVGKATIVVDP